MDAVEVVDCFVEEHLAPFMAGRGYSRRRARFHRRENGLWRVLSVQRSQWGSRDGTSVTLHVGIGSDARLRRFSAKPRPPHDYECEVAAPLAEVLRGVTADVPADGWWAVEPGQDPAALVASVLPLVERFGLPWLERYRTDLDLMDALIAQPDTAMRAVPLAIAHHRLDMADAALAPFRQQITRREAAFGPGDTDVRRWRDVLAEIEASISEARSRDA